MLALGGRPDRAHHTIKAASPVHGTHSTANKHTRVRRGGVRRRPACSQRNSLSTMQLNGASGLRAGNRQRKRVQELAAGRRTMMASASLGGGALACAVDSASCPSPGPSPIYGRDSSHCLSHLACCVSNRILPEASSRDDKLYAVSCVPDARI